MMRMLRRGLAIKHLLSGYGVERAAAGALNNKASLQSVATRRTFAAVKDVDLFEREIRFTSGAPRPSLQSGDSIDHKAPDERTLQLGKTVRELHERLPTLLQTPLPSDILSPQITLHLFPTTHPHLPTVSGRLAYAAALWTAPVAWGRIPLIGNVKLTILSERMVKFDGCAVGQEKLVVKWQTRGRGGHRDTSGGMYRDARISARDPEEKIKHFLEGSKSDAAESSANEDFCGLFIFGFDENGRIVKHIIEHVERGGYEDKMTKFVSVTDWLLGKFNTATKGEGMPALVFCEQEMMTRHQSQRIS